MKEQRGFTIVEVSLFLAISSLVAVLLLAGLSNMVRQQQWRDSINTMRTLMQSEYQNVRAGLNNRTNLPSGCTSEASSAGTSNCFAIGRVIQFTNNSSDYTVSDVFATKVVNSDSASNDIAALNASGLKIHNKSATSVPWSNTFVSGRLLDDSTSEIFNTVAILRSPVSSAILVFGLNGVGNITAGTLPSSVDSFRFNSPMALLIRNGDGYSSNNSGGAVCIGGGSSSSTVQIAAPIDLNINNNDLKRRCQL